MPDVAADAQAPPEPEPEEETAPVKPARSEEERADKRKARIFIILLLVLVAAYVATFLTLALLRYSNFRGSGFDSAIYNQIVWLFSRFKAPVSTIRGMHFFGDHLSPILALLSPLDWLGGGKPPAILTLQTVALGAGAIPLYILAVRKLKSRWVALGIAAAYLLYPALQNLNLADFHPEALGTAFLLFAFLAIDKKRFIWFYVLCFLTVITKEDMALPVLVLGIVVYFLYDKRAGKIVTLGSIVYFVAAVVFLIPHFAPAGYQYTGRLKAFGTTTGAAIKNFFLHPRHTLSVLASRENLRYIFDLLLPVAFLSVFAPVYLLPALPAFFVNIISDFQPQHTITYQYAVAIIPFVFIALIFGLKRFSRWSEGAYRSRFVMGGIVVVVLACSLAGNFYFGPSPLAAEFRTANYGTDKHITAIRKGLDLIPDSASVSAQTYFLAHLSNREKLYQFPEPFRYLVDKETYGQLGKMLSTIQSDAEKIIFPNTYRMKDEGRSIAPRYVMLDSGGHVTITKDMYERLIGRLKTEGGYVTIFSDDGVQVLKKI
ncbi:MAG: DUF2079 domain-containing protein [Candidatus Geothermincolia bacterium]